MRLHWNDKTHLIADGVEFAVDDALAPTPVEGAGLHLRKPRWMIELYEDLSREFMAPNVVELGIYEGGSTALFSLLLRPRRLVALDLTAERVPALDAFLEVRELGEVVHSHFGVNQADRAKMESIITEEFGDDPLDLVIDDASHLLAETTASFNLLFARLRPGGVFVIEDWSWQHFHDDALARALVEDERARLELERRIVAGEITATSEVPLSRLVVELMLTTAYDDTVVAEVIGARRGWVAVRRGSADLDAGTFNISERYGWLGRSLLA